MVKKPRKKSKKMPAVPTLGDVLHDLENMELVQDGSQANTSIPTTIGLSTITRFDVDSTNPPIRSTDPFWRDFMQNLKDLERLKIIESEIYNIRTRLAVERQDAANHNEELRQNIEKQKAVLTKVPK